MQPIIFILRTFFLRCRTNSTVSGQQNLQPGLMALAIAAENPVNIYLYSTT
jgi:hypothetical protein